MAKRDEFDVCVIGTGAGGGVMIQELTAAGFRVVALQRGPFLKPADFEDDELRTVIRDEVFSPDQVETYRYDDRSPTETGKFNYTANCVGGTMTHWAAWSWRFRPDDFRVLSTEGPVAGASLADWPITYDEIEPFYERAEWDFGVSGDAEGNPFGAPRKKGYPNPAHPGRRASDRLAKGLRKLGHHPFPTPVAINSRPHGDRPECAYGGACLGYGCPIGAKATTLSVCIPEGARHREARSSSERRRARDHDREGRARAQRALSRRQTAGARGLRPPHRRRRQRHRHAAPAAHVDERIVSGRPGELERPRRLQSDAPPHCRRSRSRSTSRRAASPGCTAIVAFDDFHPSDPKRGFIRGGVVGEANSPTNQPLSFGLITYLGYPAKRTWGRELKDYLRKFPRSVALAAVLEDLPMEANRVDLDPTVKDRYGLPAPRITHRQHPNDFAMNRWYTQKMLAVADASRRDRQVGRAILLASQRTRGHEGIHAFPQHLPHGGRPETIGRRSLVPEPRRQESVDHRRQRVPHLGRLQPDAHDSRQRLSRRGPLRPRSEAAERVTSRKETAHVATVTP